MLEFQWMNPRLEGEGDIGAASSAPEVPVTPSVEAGAGAPAEGIAPAAAPAEPAAPDVTQQESFAARLKEERQKLEADYTPHKTRSTEIERIAKQAGFSNAEEYIQALDADVRQRAAADAAQRLGVDEETYQTHFQPVHEELQTTKDRLQQLEQADLQRKVLADYERLKGNPDQYPDFVTLQDQVFDLAEKRLMPLEDAYKLVSFDSRVAKAKADGQAAAVKAIQDNANSSTGAVGGDAPSQVFDFTKLSREEREVYYEKAKRGELKSLH